MVLYKSQKKFNKGASKFCQWVDVFDNSIFEENYICKSNEETLTSYPFVFIHLKYFNYISCGVAVLSKTAGPYFWTSTKMLKKE